ncbi:hypothetical protein DESHY_20146 [Desulforamulus hydrothermalis Lam5 = DSM 18033]|uniref:Uncharacterized protein n=1 Tax=Desulforamulus hydrothermalis Lam5 = DSM 18033 TaxID=1121428 RepID=K8DZ40_9FIRM|nr:hypothetical protein DESHY_20146 [Desulforamulus hydrothermalis Lam5 = DSM 18033]SHH37480.1 hypothetical protein SAMN02745177_02341 [Desulforamulus hydrothermalis Lam5 = DSM 18033]
MGFLVQNLRKSNEQQKIKWLDIELLVIGKRLGLTFTEINELRCQDLLDFVDAYTRKKDDEPRMATQEDIDKFFA